MRKSVGYQLVGMTACMMLAGVFLDFSWPILLAAGLTWTCLFLARFFEGIFMLAFRLGEIFRVVWLGAGVAIFLAIARKLGVDPSWTGWGIGIAIGVLNLFFDRREVSLENWLSIPISY